LAPFGLTLKNKNVDELLVGKIRRNLKYWDTIHLTLISKVVIVNFMFALSFWFFLNMGGGHQKGGGQMQNIY